MKTLLVTLPSHDKTTHYSSKYAKQALKLAKNFKVIELERPGLTKKNFSTLISKQDPSFIFFNGHGSEKKIFGDQIRESEEVLIEEGNNDHLLSGRLTYARTCFAARSLGNACTKDGNGCFIGYKIPFSFWIDNNYYSRPLSDKTAKLFLEPSNEVVISLLKGSTAKEAADKFVELSKKNILKLLKSEEPHAMDLIPELWSNIEGQEVLGDEYCTIASVGRS